MEQFRYGIARGATAPSPTVAELLSAADATTKEVMESFTADYTQDDIVAGVAKIKKAAQHLDAALRAEFPHETARELNARAWSYNTVLQGGIQNLEGDWVSGAIPPEHFHFPSDDEDAQKASTNFAHVTKCEGCDTRHVVMLSRDMVDKLGAASELGDDFVGLALEDIATQFNPSVGELLNTGSECPDCHG